MFVFGRLSTVRSRLLAMMAVIVVPLAILSLVIATIAYRSIVSRVADTEMQITSEYAIRARVWFVTSVRSLLTLGYTAAPFAGTTQGCMGALQPILKAMQWWQAVSIQFANGNQCFASTDDTVSREVAASILADQAQLPASKSWTGAQVANYRFGATRINGKSLLVIYVDNRPKDGAQAFNAVLLIDKTLFAFVLDLGQDSTEMTTALMSGPDRVIVQRGGSSEDDRTWLPKEFRMPLLREQWVGQSRDGADASYVAHLVSEPSLYILSRFDNSAERAALIQLGFLSVTPLLLLGLLYLAYARGIQSNVIRWLSSIEGAARSRIRDPLEVKAVPIEPGMPEDMRNVAEAFNTMVIESVRRETILAGALDANRFLMRELHHRVKNSLQVIQSYLAFSRRQSPTEDRGLSDTEAKVLVLSIAYRLTLTEHGMQSASVHRFITEVAAHVEQVFGTDETWMTQHLTGDGGLEVDRLIPIGLAMVESVIACLTSKSTTGIVIELKNEPDGKLRLRIRTANDRAINMPPAKILAGLAVQLGATLHPLQPGEIVNWTFSP
jgi:two-component system, sensor histidine kinase PdtaS